MPLAVIRCNNGKRKTSPAAYTASYEMAWGNRQTILELDGSRVTYTYDPSYQLLSEQRSGKPSVRASYAYDGLGNRLTQDKTEFSRHILTMR